MKKIIQNTISLLKQFDNSAKNSITKIPLTFLWLMVFIANIFWFTMFSPWTSHLIPFWYMMTFSTIVLATLGLCALRKNIGSLFEFKKADIVLGFISAVILYLTFWIGYYALSVLFDFVSDQVVMIYANKSDAPKYIIALLLMFIIAPAEEIFWRGFIQKRLSQKYGAILGLIFGALLYTFVHIYSLNFMLLIASAVCGIFWGILFSITNRLWPSIISHALWDVTIFVLFPIG